MKRMFRSHRFLLTTLAFLAADYVTPATAADANLYVVCKRQVFVQTNSATPVPHCCPFMFNAVVELAGSNSVLGATAVAPSGVQSTLSLQSQTEFLPRCWVLSQNSAYPTREMLDASWPGGEYRFSIFGASDGITTPILNLSGDAYPKNAPHFRNFEEAQAVDTSKDFVLEWEPFAEGTTNDYCFVLITRKSDQAPVSNTSFLKEENRLDGTATSISIPAGTLAPGVEYDAYVRFDKVIVRDTATYRGVTGHASYASGTHMSLKSLP